jgi:hypothetical protein
MCYVWITVACGVDIRTPSKIDQKYLESFGIWCWRRVEKIIWTGSVRNEAVLHRVKVDRNILHIGVPISP